MTGIFLMYHYSTYNNAYVIKEKSYKIANIHNMM